MSTFCRTLIFSCLMGIALVVPAAVTNEPIEAKTNSLESTSFSNFPPRLNILNSDSNSIPGDEYWDERFDLNQVSGPVYAIDTYYTHICIGGDFHQVGNLPAENFACWNLVTETWLTYDTGFSGPVYAINMPYVGGQFSQAGSTIVQNIAKWNDSSKKWEDIGGTSGVVYALKTGFNGLYVGGHFSQAGSTVANNVATWHEGTQTWSALASGQSNGVSGPVHALEVVLNYYPPGEDYVFVGGIFTGIGGVSNVNAHNIAQWNSNTRAWTEVNGSVSGPVYALKVCGDGHLYVGGDFNQAGPITAENIAAWDRTATSWSALGQGTSSAVEAIDCIGNRVYVGGHFSQAGNVIANHVARWNTTAQTWSGLGSGVSNTVFSLMVRDAAYSYFNVIDVYVGGLFISAGSTYSRHLAIYTGDYDNSNPDDVKWDIDYCQPGPNNKVSAIAASGDTLYFGGNFTQSGALTTNHIAKFDATSNTWSAIGQGINGNIEAIAISGSDVYFGGEFSEANGISATNIVRWNSVSGEWSVLGSGTNGPVNDIAVIDDGVYVGGDFTTAGGVTVNHVARWDVGTKSWSALGGGTWIGMNAPVHALAVTGSDLYAGGSFTYAQDVLATYIAKWDGNVWSALGGGVNAHVYDVAIQGNDVYVGGYFSQAGGNPASKIARWDGTTWHAMPGLVHTTRAITFNLGEVFVGGEYNTPGGSGVNGVGRWDGSQWLPLGSGAGGTRALAVGPNGLYLGGSSKSLGNGLFCDNTSSLWRVPTTPPDTGVISGRIHSPSGAVVSGASVQVCSYIGETCSWQGITDTNGDYQANALADGEYRVQVYPPQGLMALPTSSVPVLVNNGDAHQVGVNLHAVMPLTSGASITPSRQTNAGVPLVNWKQAVEFSIQGCAGGSATYQLLQEGSIVREGALSESPAGHYSTSIDQLYPTAGYVQMIVNESCPIVASSQNVHTFDIYVDPTGTVNNIFGLPIEGATVTLYAYDPVLMSLTKVPEGDSRLSPINRANPDLTDSAGHYGWDVSTGVYAIRAEKDGCLSPDNPEQAYVQTGLLTAPFETVDIDLLLSCTGDLIKVYLPLTMR